MRWWEAPPHLLGGHDEDLAAGRVDDRCAGDPDGRVDVAADARDGGRRERGGHVRATTARRRCRRPGRRRCRSRWPRTPGWRRSAAGRRGCPSRAGDVHAGVGRRERAARGVDPGAQAVLVVRRPRRRGRRPSWDGPAPGGTAAAPWSTSRPPAVRRGAPGRDGQDDGRRGAGGSPPCGRCGAGRCMSLCNHCSMRPPCRPRDGAAGRAVRCAR